MTKPGDGFGGISDAVAREVGAIMFTAGQIVQTEAQISITEGAVSGKYHTPSKPGDPPNQNSGSLSNNIETVQTGPLEVQVSSNAPYAVALELGTVKMAPRPYMQPALSRSRKEITALVARAVSTALKGKGK